MNILQVAGFAWEPKGTVRARAYPLAMEMVRRGHRVAIAIAPYDNLNYSGKEFLTNGVQIINLHIPNRDRLTLAGIPWKLMKVVDKIKPDVVHVFKPKGFAGLVAMALLDKGYRSIVLDCDDWEGWGGWNEVQQYPWIVKAFIDIQERWLIRTCPIITVASRVLLDRVLEAGRGIQRVFYIPNGVCSEQIQLSEALISAKSLDCKRKLSFSSAPLILYAGHFDPADDVEFFYRATADIAAAHNATIALVGDGPALAETVQFFSQYPSLSVRSFGRLAYEKFAELVACCDAAVFPYPESSIYRAKCSARIIDYMAFGKPILTTAIGQNPEYLVHGESGLLVAPGDVQGYQRSLERLLKDSQLRSYLGQNARHRLLEKFQWSGSTGDDCEKAYQCAAVLGEA